MVYALIGELSCAATGDDCKAQEAWLASRMASHPDWNRMEAACKHWEQCDDTLRDALAATLGISQPFPDEREPVNPHILSDYQLAQAVANALLEYS